MPAAVEQIWSVFHERLRGFVLARVRDEHAADDILQDVFLKLHRGVGSLRDEERVAPWLFQVARNAVTDHFRGAHDHRFEGEDALRTIEDERSDVPVEQRLADGLFEMVDQLPARYREAIRLTEIEGLTQAEMAERLGLSLSGAKSRVQRGREKLKDLLLDCCHVEFDHRGAISGYQRRCCPRRT